MSAHWPSRRRSRRWREQIENTTNGFKVSWYGGCVRMEPRRVARGTPSRQTDAPGAVADAAHALLGGGTSFRRLRAPRRLQTCVTKRWRCGTPAPHTCATTAPRPRMSGVWRTPRRPSTRLSATWNTKRLSRRGTTQTCKLAQRRRAAAQRSPAASEASSQWGVPQERVEAHRFAVVLSAPTVVLIRVPPHVLDRLSAT
jgi:hypothetical protein